MTADVQGQITSELFKALLEGVSVDRGIPITVTRSSSPENVSATMGRFNVIVLTSEQPSPVPDDADDRYGDIAYKKDGHLYITEDLDAMFLGSTSRLSEMFFEPIGALIDELPPQPTGAMRGSLQAFGETLTEHIEEAVTEAEVELERIQQDLEDAERTRTQLNRMRANTRSARNEMQQRLNDIQSVNWSEAERFLSGLGYESFDGEDNCFWGITPDLHLEGTYADEYGEPVDVSHNFGKLKVEIIAEDGGVILKAIPYSNNIWSQEFYHPHVSSDGFICFGNMRDAADEAKANLDFTNMFSLSLQVLSEYSAENPHRHIQRF